MEVIMQAFPVFLLIFCRITSFFVVAPVFSTRNVPAPFKIGLSFFVALIIFLTYGITKSVPTDTFYIVSILREIIVGLLMGFTAYIFFSAIHTAGGFIDMQIGFGIANVIDPVSGLNSPIMGGFKYLVATLLFLTMNGHHYLLNALVRSYEVVPLTNELFGRIAEGRISEFLVLTFARAFVLAFQLAAPLVVALFLTDVGLGFLARTAPQFNVFVIGIPLKIIVGLLMLFFVISGLAVIFQQLFARMFESLDQLLYLMNAV